MVSKGDFFKELMVGQKYEKKAQVALIRYLNTDLNVVEERNDNLYDFQLSNGKTYEVKFDKMCSKTGNLFIETVSRGKASGLTVSVADYYIFCIGEEDTKFYMIETDKLREMIKNKEYMSLYDNYSKTASIFKLHTVADKSIQF